MQESEKASRRPIDIIFMAHNAIREEVLSLEHRSGEVANCVEGFLDHFTERFRLLWNMHKAHSDSEDHILFPALRSKKTLKSTHNRSFTKDHKQAEKMFKDISEVLKEFSRSFRDFGESNASLDRIMKQNEFALKLQDLCRSLSESLERHLRKEEAK